jgi:hypothetical protein
MPKLMTLLILAEVVLKMAEASVCSDSACHDGVQLLQTTLHLQEMQTSLDKDRGATASSIGKESDGQLVKPGA